MRRPRLRRTALPLLVLASAAGCATSGGRPVPSEASRSAMAPRDALRELRSGNERFASGDSRRHDMSGRVLATAQDAWPFAAVLTAVDSRVAPEYLFDQGLGNLLVVRVGGMVVSDDILGSLEYAGRVRGAKLIVVLGHTDSEAIAVASDPPDYELGHMTAMIERLSPALEAVPAHITPRDATNPRFLAEANRAHVWRTMELIRERSPVLRELIVKGDVWLIGAMYDVQTGRVEWFE